MNDLPADEVIERSRRSMSPLPRLVADVKPDDQVAFRVPVRVRMQHEAAALDAGQPLMLFSRSQ